MKAKAKKKDLDWATARKLGNQANVDPRTIRRVARGESVRGLAGTRAKEVLVKEGILAA